VEHIDRRFTEDIFSGGRLAEPHLTETHLTKSIVSSYAIYLKRG